MKTQNPPFTVFLVDSKVSPYVTNPTIEQETLSGIAKIELLQVESAKDLIGRIENADAIISWHLIPIPDFIFSTLKKCKGIVRAAVGFDNIDMRAAAEYKIPVANVPDYGTEEVADHTLMLLLNCIRRTKSAQSEVEVGGWNWRVIESARRIRATNLGIVGFGRIGSAVAARAKSFGFNVFFYDPYLPSGVEKSHGVNRAESLEQLFSSCSCISLHAPLNHETRSFINESVLKLMPRSSILINTARGELINMDDLRRSMSQGDLAQVGLDVVAGEPKIPSWLEKNPNAVITPHAAFYSIESMTELRLRSAKIIAQFLQGKLPRETINISLENSNVK